MRSNATGILMLVCLLGAWPAVAEEPAKLAVMALRVDTELPKGMDRTLNEILLGEFHRRHGQEVLGASDIAAILQVEQQKILLGCDDDSCLAELGGALGVGLVVVPSIGAVGDKYVINLKLLDVAEARVLARVNQYVAREENEILDGIRAAVAQLMAETGAPAPDDGLGFMDVAPWVALGLTVAAAGTGGAFGAIALQEDKQAADAIRGSDDWRSSHDAAADNALMADVMFGVAGAAAVTTLILFLVDGDDEADVSAGLAPAPDGGVAAVGIRF